MEIKIVNNNKILLNNGNEDLEEPEIIDIKKGKNSQKKVIFKEETNKDQIIPINMNSVNEEPAQEIRKGNIIDSKDNNDNNQGCKCFDCSIF